MPESLDFKRRLTRSREHRVQPCPECESTSIETRIQAETFLYGVEPESIQISATVPVQRCQSCGFEWFDHLAEVAKHEAVCRHLGLLTPREVRAIREKHGLSKVKLAELTHIGIATISRWERGIQLQSPGYDKFLRLISYSDNVVRLRGIHHVPRGDEAERRFASISDINAARREAASFRL
jgi:putative zinc finger/helix-turn-helix YgiT family protein